MTKIIYSAVVHGCPRTKKNSPQIRRGRGGKRYVAPSDAFLTYQDRAGWELRNRPEEPLGGQYNVRVLYYMDSLRRVDLSNLLESTCDILVHYGIIKDDNSRIVCSHDGSRVLLDREHPRAEIFVEEVAQDG